MTRLLVLAMIMSSLWWQSAVAEPCWMVLGIDVSNSITKHGEDDLQRAGYATAFANPELTDALADCRIRVVEWAARAEVMTPWITPGEFEAAYPAVHAKSGTMTSPVALMKTALTLLRDMPGRRLVNITTDGVENERQGEVEAARVASLAAGLEVNVLLVNMQVVDADLWWARRLATGFVLHAREFSDFATALWRKLEMELAGR